jgi:hypothetical protein
MSDIKALQDLVIGLNGAIVELQSQKDLFVRAQGIDIEAQKLRDEALKFNTDITAKKARVKELQEQKRAAIKNTLDAMKKSMTDVLATGSAVIEILEDGKFFIGWVNEAGQTVPYPGLSGGEKVSFDTALVKALGGTIMVTEAAEVDEKSLSLLLTKYANSEIKQIIVSTCHAPNVIDAEWSVTTL